MHHDLHHSVMVITYLQSIMTAIHEYEQLPVPGIVSSVTDERRVLIDVLFTKFISMESDQLSHQEHVFSTFFIVK